MRTNTGMLAGKFEKEKVSLLIFLLIHWREILSKFSGSAAVYLFC